MSHVSQPFGCDSSDTPTPVTAGHYGACHRPRHTVDAPTDSEIGRPSCNPPPSTWAAGARWWARGLRRAALGEACPIPSSPIRSDPIQAAPKASSSHPAVGVVGGWCVCVCDSARARPCLPSIHSFIPSIPPHPKARGPLAPLVVPPGGGAAISLLYTQRVHSHSFIHGTPTPSLPPFLSSLLRGASCSGHSFIEGRRLL